MEAHKLSKGEAHVPQHLKSHGTVGEDLDNVDAFKAEAARAQLEEYEEKYEAQNTVQILNHFNY